MITTRMNQFLKNMPLLLVVTVCLLPKYSTAFSADSFFSLSAYQKACAVETSQSLDASRLHLQILFVDDDNTMGRISEGLLERVAEYNDALFVLFPSSCTLNQIRNAPLDAAPTSDAIQMCSDLGLCETRSTAMGTSFDLTYLDESDLIVCADDHIRSLMLSSLSIENQEHYAPRCRLLSEFLSPAFSMANNQRGDYNFNTASIDTITNNNQQTLLDMIDSELKHHVTYEVAEEVLGSSSNVFKSSDELKIPALILASAGLTRFCLDTIATHLEADFQRLLEANFATLDKIPPSWQETDAQLTRCCASVTGYFSPKQRQTRFEEYKDSLARSISSCSNNTDE